MQAWEDTKAWKSACSQSNRDLALTDTSYEAGRISQVKFSQNQSLQDINPPVREEDEEPSIVVPHKANQPQSTTENKIQGRKPQVRWPKSCEKKEWKTIDTDISNLLGQLRGTVVKKLEWMGDLIYNYGAERFGTAEKRKKASSTPAKSRRQQVIERQGEKAAEKTMEENPRGGGGGN